MFRKKITLGRIIPPFFFERSESDRVFNYLPDSNSIFRVGGIISEIFFRCTAERQCAVTQEDENNNNKGVKVGLAFTDEDGRKRRAITAKRIENTVTLLQQGERCAPNWRNARAS